MHRTPPKPRGGESKLAGDEAKRIRKNIGNISSWDIMDQFTPAKWFDPDWMLGIKDGFDLVIGNPPYIRQEKIKAFKNTYEARQYKIYKASADLYTYFYEQGFNLLKKGGHLCFITSNQWLRAGYGEKLRKLIKDETSIKQIIDLGSKNIFKAAVDTNIIIFARWKPAAKNKLLYGTDIPRENKNLAQMRQQLLEYNVFTLEPPEVFEIKKQIDKLGSPLKEWGDLGIKRGIVTGLNAAFVINEKQKEELFKAEPKSKDIIKPLLRGKYISSYSYKPNEEWLINTHNGYHKKNGAEVKKINVEDYPAIKKHLDQYTKELQTREDKGDTHYHLRSCNYIEEFGKEKIILPKFADKLTASLDKNSICILDSCNMISCHKQNKYILRSYH